VHTSIQRRMKTLLERHEHRCGTHPLTHAHATTDSALPYKCIQMNIARAFESRSNLCRSSKCDCFSIFRMAEGKLYRFRFEGIYEKTIALGSRNRLFALKRQMCLTKRVRLFSMLIFYYSAMFLFYSEIRVGFITFL
jgi:hypothetical protein